jgi:hypothetical protein
MRLRAVSPPLLDRVYSVLPNKAPYRCGDVAELDEHLRDLSARIAATRAQNSPLVRDYRADQDQLLDRRMYLQMLET